MIMTCRELGRYNKSVEGRTQEFSSLSFCSTGRRFGRESVIISITPSEEREAKLKERSKNSEKERRREGSLTVALALAATQLVPSLYCDSPSPFRDAPGPSLSSCSLSSGRWRGSHFPCVSSITAMPPSPFPPCLSPSRLL
ncbi:uncharacterized protein DS421_18g618260 [Arachis hypogaea]|nr:uncharacterized protein DS421_18g618260 [Arachis hypogaea]